MENGDIKAALQKAEAENIVLVDRTIDLNFKLIVALEDLRDSRKHIKFLENKVEGLDWDRRKM